MSEQATKLREQPGGAEVGAVMHDLLTLESISEEQTMTTIEKSRVKNAPLFFTEDHRDFVEWTTSVPDGSLSAGWQALPAHMESRQNSRAKSPTIDTSRRSLAKFVELSRRRLGHSVEQLAETAGVDLAELLAVEAGECNVQPRTLERLASFLKVNPQRLLQLAGLMPGDDGALEKAALQFAARTESVRPLEAQEQSALDRFCDEVFAEGMTSGETRS